MKRVETRKRGVFGTIFLWLFWAFNALMAFVTWRAVSTSSEMIGMQVTEAEKAASAIGSGAAVAVVIFIWLAGAVILGLFALLTRGKTVIVETAD